MTKSNHETRELNVEDLDTVAGGMPFYGMGCSVNQNNRIGAFIGGLGGGFLGGLATAIARLYCA
jgi:hypothetical protein